jgi:enoyl-[acyl-carrier-protein] reductase (NADH)
MGMAIVKRMMLAGATVILGYMVKKFVKRLEAQAETMKQRAEDQRDPRDFKKLKQDPTTGEYYAED